MNLTTETGRKEAIEAIEQSFINALRDIGVELSEEVKISICQNSIDIYHKHFGSSQVIIWANNKHNHGNTIHLGSAGCSFTPKMQQEYWRTIHAASILKNWEKVCESVNEHCKRYSELVNEIQKQNR